jgi:hypothetical protein
MFRMALGLSLVALCCAGGCTMCCHPYDYSGPVYSKDDCPSCGSSGHCRAGSILAPCGQPSSTEGDGEKAVPQTAPKTAPQPAPTRAKPVEQPSVPDPAVGGTKVGARQRHLVGKPRPGDVPGSEKIVSVTERVVGPKAGSQQTAAEPAAEPEAEASNSLPAAGWTARRLTNDTMR